MNSRSSFSEISPFYAPDLPAQSMPLSTIAQTEVGKMFSPGKLLAQEEIGPESLNTRSLKSVRFSPYRKPTVHVEPPVQQVTLQHFFQSEPRSLVRSSGTTYTSRARSATPSSTKEPLDSDESSEDEEADEDDDDKDPLIPKPEGEAGRPGRGGYNLEDTLGWNKKDYKNFKAYIKTLIEEHLDSSKSFLSQELASIQVVRELANKKVPELLRYKDSWPAIDLVRLRLKYTSGRARVEQSKSDAVAGKRLRLGSRA